tara:strand:- start:93 stop:488 length:396 start_codon:yes stop_codon:yes gene_type:complete
MVFSLSTPGCFDAKEEFYYSVDDLHDESNTIGTSDILFSLTLNDDGGIDMDISDLVVTVERSGTHVCSSSSNDANCTIVQTGSDDSLWEIGEILNITENGVNICSRHCIISFIVEGPEDAKIVGPTLLNTK